MDFFVRDKFPRHISRLNTNYTISISAFWHIVKLYISYFFSFDMS